MHGEYFLMVHTIQISIDEVMYVQCIQCVCTYVNESKSYTQLFVEFLCMCINEPIVILDKHPKKVYNVQKKRLNQTFLFS
jgi:hypothetical protein